MTTGDEKDRTRTVFLSAAKPPGDDERVTLVVIEGPQVGDRFVLTERETVIGRAADAAVRLSDAHASRRHASVSAAAGKVRVTDLGSRNGTLINGKKVGKAAAADGDRIQVGTTVFKVFVGDTAELKVYEMATRDGLTGLLNRASADARLQAEFGRHRRFGTPLAVLLCDLDHFKEVNDTHGHAAGDLVLRSVAAVVARHVRGTDVAGRFGGEEVILILPDTDRNGAMRLAERVRAAVERTETPAPTGADPAPTAAIRVTMSIGVAAAGTAEEESAEALLARADANLYASKNAGRNRVSG